MASYVSAEERYKYSIEVTLGEKPELAGTRAEAIMMAPWNNRYSYKAMQASQWYLREIFMKPKSEQFSAEERDKILELNMVGIELVKFMGKALEAAGAGPMPEKTEPKQCPTCGAIRRFEQ